MVTETIYYFLWVSPNQMESSSPGGQNAGNSFLWYIMMPHEVPGGWAHLWCNKSYMVVSANPLSIMFEKLN